MSLVLAILAAACGDQPTEVVPEREMTGGPGGIANATSSTEDGLSITTDKDDYAPGDTVFFTGAGWLANDVLDIVLTDDPTHDYHEWTVTVGEGGTFRDSTYVVDIGDLGVTFTLTATSRATGRSLAVQFTDAELVTAELTAPVNDVTVTQGSNASFTISLTATGSIKCTATALSPATAKVHTVFAISAGGVVSSNTLSAAFNFFGGTPIGGPNCSVTWTGAPTAYTASASVSTAATTPPGDYTVTLSPGAGSVVLTNPAGMGGSLADDVATTITVHVVAPTNQPPTVNAGGPYSGNESSAISISGTASDLDGDAVTTTWSVDNGGYGTTICTIAAPGSLNTTVTCSDNGTFTLTLSGTDGKIATPVTSTATLTVANVAPVITSLSLPVNPVPVNTVVNLSGAFTDAGSNDTHTATIDWDDGANEAGTVTQGSGSGSVAKSHTYTSPGIYAVRLTVTDDDGDSDIETFEYVVVYDPSAGFVTGGGWIISPAGAYGADPDLTGKATFGFVSKYQKGATVPTGNTEFQFHAGNLNFKSTSYDWLVVQGGSSKATYKGYGTVNGVAGYGFLLSAIDGSSDRFRIKIWQTGGAIIYDNGSGGDNADPTTEIAGGSIVIHVPKK